MIEKQIAAQKAVEFVKDGMTIGLGTGSTVAFLINELAEKVKGGLRIKAVSTSSSTTHLASLLGIEVFDLNKVAMIDLTIDGADEVDENLDGIKGGGGALLYEKIVAKNSEQNIWIVDSSKLVKKLGKFPLPIEVIKFGSEKIYNNFADMKLNPQFRMKEGKKFVTDNGNFIIDLKLITIENVVETERLLKSMTGVVETGLFNKIADLVVVGVEDETITLKKRDQTKN
ncbi:MAG: ribose-5-phosphate isomerase RpiA [Ignavibacteria bacterium]|nr:ribose-5-phosphate isomerase RpiA [Ignavibacteria bacterium]MBT8384057.1 ribose-5-phosphate isomerase RpiA [Ignavibacteria bacterium]MBT8390261.1 ribose-5-phosphate isomerase RpiA [Ignavibacteria bacterium]NNJ53193.1 ribose-5-phosphate isomerase RpiA [Ignavibacteriaceae bacterium]NNL22302.1 ribose-5-phosphate isomerase RpiA [Ignavibacteriaceae bacterium]